MPFDEPSWWYGPPEAQPARLLAPVAAAWAAIAQRRMARATPYRSRLPVICVGNFTAGGTGKTPLALSIARQLTLLGHRPAFLTRGYGGRTAGPQRVDLLHDRAAGVGDEPLLLARAAPTVVARHRAAGARWIEQHLAAAPEAAVDCIVMDDGLQNPHLAKSLQLAVVDGLRGLGNGLVMPAGPLRAPLELQLERVDAIVVTRPAAMSADPPPLTLLRQRFHGPVLAASTRAVAPHDWLTGARVVAYAAIGAPRRFFDLLEALGATIVAEKAFPDHHAFSAREATALLDLARAQGAQLVTTEKDLVRLAGSGPAQSALLAASRVLAIETHLDERDAHRLTALLQSAFSVSR